MKALSIRQPWAWLIVQGYKDIENRTWRTNFRGRVLVHASKGMTGAEYARVQDYLYELHVRDGVGDEMIQLPRPGDLPRGGIVGSVTISGCIVPDQARSPWHMEGFQGLMLCDPLATPLIPCKGALGFFNPPEEVHRQLLRYAVERAHAIDARFHELKREIRGGADVLQL